jgi:hypothetical protein
VVCDASKLEPEDEDTVENLSEVPQAENNPIRIKENIPELKDLRSLVFFKIR